MAASKTVKPQSSARSAMLRFPSTLHSSAQSYGPSTTSDAASEDVDEHRDAVRTSDERDDLRPARVALPGEREQVGDLDGRRDVLTGALAVAELRLDDGPVQQVGHLVADLLGDEGLDHGAVDELEMDEELAETPALELGALHLERLGQGFGSERAGGHEPDAEEGSATGDGHGVDQSVPEPHRGLLPLGLGQGQAPRRPLRRELQQGAVHRDRKAHVRHA